MAAVSQLPVRCITVAQAFDSVRYSWLKLRDHCMVLAAIRYADPRID
jgi:hypothetical protein